MTKTKMQFFSHKLLLIGFMTISILGTAASCSNDSIDNKSPKAEDRSIKSSTNQKMILAPWILEVITKR